MRAEILLADPIAARGRRMLEALVDTAPIPVKVRGAYTGDAEILVTYGTGHPIRRPWWLEHRRRGGRCVGLDLGYWDRMIEGDAGMRFTLDTDHPPQWIRPEPPDRFDARGAALRSDAHPDGPVVVVGQGVKSAAVARERPGEWEARTIAKVRAALPGRPIHFRPKRAQGAKAPPGTVKRVDDSIEAVLVGASLVVCRHSNVAVDACLAGVPVVCDAGAAAALYGSNLCNPNTPTPAQRLEFLRSLAWWNWRPSEAAAAWAYLLARIRAG